MTKSGSDVSVTDGRWIITMGQFGFIGFLAEFGLLALAVVRAAQAAKFADDDEEQVLLAALALIVAINVVDLLPNASLSPWTWLLAGALLGQGGDATGRRRGSRVDMGFARSLGRRATRGVGGWSTHMWRAFFLLVALPVWLLAAPANAGAWTASVDQREGLPIVSLGGATAVSGAFAFWRKDWGWAGISTQFKVTSPLDYALAGRIDGLDLDLTGRIRSAG